jgi:WD40 repeat protein
MSASNRTFRIFVSSTFSDLVAERNALQERVFPRLRELCAQHGARFQAIDLRWGISQEASIDQQTMNICLNEIERCQQTSPRPNFILLLGDRYGWMPPPPQIPAKEFKSILAWVTNPDDNSLLHKWYRLDENAVPAEYCLQPWEGYTYEAWCEVEKHLHDVLAEGARTAGLNQEALFKYQASATHQEIDAGALQVDDAAEHVYCFFREIEEIEDLPSNFKAQVFLDELDERLIEIYPDGLPEPAYKDFIAEIKRTDPASNAREISDTIKSLMTQTNKRSPERDLLEQVHGWLVDTTAKNYLNLVDKDWTFDQNAHARQNELKEELKTKVPGNIKEYTAKCTGRGITTDHIDGFCHDVYEALESTILDELARLERVDPLESEVDAHAAFGRDRTRVFVGRGDALETIQSYLAGWDRHPLGLWGESGTGKSTLMAKAVQQTQQKYPSAKVIYRFIGATPDSSGGRALLESLCRQITKVYGGDMSSIPVEYKELVKEFPGRLTLANAYKPLYIFIDAVDQLSDLDDARDLAWLPDTLPDGVQVVVSTLAGKCKHALQNMLPPKNLVELQPMLKNEGEKLFNLWLKSAGRELQPQQYQEVITKFSSSGLPLYIKLAFEEARLWKSYSPMVSLSPDVPGIIHDLFKRLSDESNHGKRLVKRALGYLAAAKNGLSEDEMLDVLSMDEQVFQDFLDRAYHEPPEKRLPVVLWSRLYMDLAPYLIERDADGTSLMDFYHRQLAVVVQEKYLAAQDKTNRHSILADYFTQQPLYLESAAQQTPNLRKLSEQAHQQAHAGFGDALVSTLTRFDFLYERAACSGPQAAIEDYDLIALSAVSSCTGLKESGRGLELIQDALRLSAHVTARDATLLPGQVLGRLSGVDQTEVEALLEGARTWRGAPWLAPETASLAAAGGPLVYTLVGHSSQVSAVEVARDGNLCVTAGRDWTMHVWDLTTGVEVHQLKGMAGCVDTIAMSSDNRYILAGARALSKGSLLALWDIQAGRIVRQFDGHTKNVLSVSIIDGGSKAVTGSAEGKIFVWDLQSGAALKSIRTEPMTTLTVSPDGKYATSVSESGLGRQPKVTVIDLGEGETINTFELYWAPQEQRSSPDGPKMVTIASVIAFSPDSTRLATADQGGMIRVWDVNSGSELQRLEGHSGEVDALTFHHDGTRLISGSKDTSIRIWDISSGQAFSTLEGHTAGVTALEVTYDGKHLFSGSADKTLRVWALDQGVNLGTLSGHTNAVTAVTVTPDDNLALSCSMDKSLKVWDWRLAGRGEGSSVVGHSSPVTALALSPDGRWGISGAEEGDIFSWDLISGKSFHVHQTDSSITGLFFINQPGQILACAQDGKLIHLDLKSRTAHTFGKVPASRRITLAVAPNGIRLYCPVEGTIKIVDPKSGHTIGELQQGDELRLLWGLTATPDGTRVAAVYWSGTLDVWDGISGRRLHRTKPTRPQLSVSVTPDGHYALTGLNSGELHLWDLAAGQSITSWTAYDGPGSTNWITAVHITPDASLAVSGGYDGVVKLWDLRRREMIAQFQGESEIYRCAITPDAGTVIAGEKSGRVHLLRLV